MSEKRWSWLHEHCQNTGCTSPNAPHAAGGLCKVCYMREYRKTHPEKRRSMEERGHKAVIDALPAMFKRLGLVGYAISFREGILRMSRMGSSMVAEHDFNVHEEPI